MTVKEITLLSIEEYDQYYLIIPFIEVSWWLRSPGYCRDFGAYVYNDGNVEESGACVNIEHGAVRPALRFELEVSDSQFWYKPEKLIGTKIKHGKHNWTVLDVKLGELYALCDDIITRRRFDPKSNNWDTSELKQWLETDGLRLIANK